MNTTNVVHGEEDKKIDLGKQWLSDWEGKGGYLNVTETAVLQHQRT